MHEASPRLFDFFNMPPAHKRRGPAGFTWLIRKRRNFTFFVFLSLVAHLALLGMFIILGPEEKAPLSHAASQAQDFQLFREALQEYAVDGNTPKSFLNILTEVSEEDLSYAYYYSPKLDDRLTNREKVGLYKMMVAKAMADLKERTGEQSALDLPVSQYFKSLRETPLADPSEDFSLVQIGNTLDESARLFRVSKENTQALESLSLLNKEPKNLPNEVKLLDGQGHYWSVPGGYFFRDSPYLQIVAVGAKLFSIIRGFPELPVAKTRLYKTDPLPQDAQKNLSSNERSPYLDVVFMPSYRRRAPMPALTVKPSLVLPAEEAEQVLDGLMTLPVDEQVRIFNRDYLQIYDPDSLDLALLTDAFIYKNLGMVFNLTVDPLSRGFDFLEELYFDYLSMHELVPYALKNPESRTGAAILLCLAASYEFERRAIISLDGSLDAAKLVLVDPSNNRLPVHNKEVKAYVLREVYRDLATELRSRYFLSLGSVLQIYRDEQLKIYDLLAEMDGDIKCRAQYALGRFYWDECQADLALTTWKEIDPAFSAKTLAKIRNAMNRSGSPSQIDSAVRFILEVEAASDSAGLLDRTVKFNKWKNR